MNGSNGLAQENLNAIDLRKVIPADALQRLSEVNNPRSILIIVATWVTIFLLITAAYLASSVVVTVVTIVFIAGRQHALLVLMHDAAHRLLFKNGRINDVVANVCLSFPLFVSTALYRRHHLAHHRFTNSLKDPDIEDTDIPQTLRGLLLSLVGDLLGLRSFKLTAALGNFGVTSLFTASTDKIRNLNVERNLAIVFYLTLITSLTYFGLWLSYLLYWIVPMWFVLPALLHVRAIGEHAGRTEDSVISHARSIRANLVERALICPLNVNLHLEHHLFPEVPFFSLDEVSHYLEKNPSVAGKVPRTFGYIFGSRSVFSELYFRNQSTAAS